MRTDDLLKFQAGKDTTTGHWELSGVSLKDPFPLFPKGFPSDFISAFEKRIDRGTIGNYAASGTVIIDQLGAEHLATGKVIVYTSGDSVFQIAAHDEIIPLKQLYEICEIAREMLKGDLAVGRVIARPFVGKAGSFKRTEHRKRFFTRAAARNNFGQSEEGGFDERGAWERSEDIFANRGLTDLNHTGNNHDGVDGTIRFIQTRKRGFIFTNLVDFDSLYGHRNDPKGICQRARRI